MRCTLLLSALVLALTMSAHAVDPSKHQISESMA